MAQVYCQSCGMPMTNHELFGTEAGGAKSQEYCTYCYENGAFQQPELTMAQMIEVCVPFMVQNGMEQQAATALMQQTLPQLKRWRKG